MQIVVLGMHRSGTSAVARLLNLMGAYFGGENISTGASAENEKGFWERLDVRALNDSMLHNANCDWDRIAELNLRAIPDDYLNAYQRSARDIVLNLDAHRPWFIKEPRLCVLLPLWRPVLELPFCVYVFRHPMEVAHSLKERNGIPIKAGLALWEAYNTKAIESSSDLPRVFVSYSEALASPQPVVDRLRKAMSTNGYSFRTPSDDELAGSLDSSLRHQRYEDDGARDSPSKSQLALYELLNDAVTTGEVTAPPMARASLNALRRYESSGEHLAARMRRSNARQRGGSPNIDPKLALKSMELDQALKTVSERSTALSDAAKSNAKLTGELNKKNTDLAMKDDAIKRLTADVENRRSVLAKRDERIRNLTVELETRAAALAAKEDAFTEVRERAAENQALLNTRDADIKDLIREVAALTAASEGKDNSLTRLSAELDDIKGTSAAKDESLAQTQAELKDARAGIAAKDDSLAQTQAELEHAHAAAAAKDDSLAQTQAELEHARAAAAAKDDSLAQARAELEDARAAAAAKDDSLAQARAELEDARAAAAAKDDSLAQARAELEDARAAAAAKDDSLAQSKAELAETKATSTKKDNSLARLASEFAQVQGELGSKVEAVERLAAEVRDYETRTAINKDTIERLTSESKRRLAELSSMEHTVRRLTAETRHLRAELDTKSQSLAASSVTVTRLRNEVAHLQNRTERAVKRITDESVKIADENRNLKQQGELAAENVARFKSEIDALRLRHRDLTDAVDAVLSSRRWRVGNFLLSLPYTLLFRRVPPMATDTIKRISATDSS